MLTLLPITDEPTTLALAVEEYADARDEMLHHLRAVNVGGFAAEYAISRLVDAVRVMTRLEMQDTAQHALHRDVVS
jgi:hypothetical protein